MSPPPKAPTEQCPQCAHVFDAAKAYLKRSVEPEMVERVFATYGRPSCFCWWLRLQEEMARLRPARRPAR